MSIEEDNVSTEGVYPFKDSEMDDAKQPKDIDINDIDLEHNDSYETKYYGSEDADINDFDDDDDSDVEFELAEAELMTYDDGFDGNVDMLAYRDEAITELIDTLDSDAVDSTNFLSNLDIIQHINTAYGDSASVFGDIILDDDDLFSGGTVGQLLYSNAESPSYWLTAYTYGLTDVPVNILGLNNTEDAPIDITVDGETASYQHHTIRSDNNIIDTFDLNTIGQQFVDND
jgi:hypothetical protein